MAKFYQARGRARVKEASTGRDGLTLDPGTSHADPDPPAICSSTLPASCLCPLQLKHSCHRACLAQLHQGAPLLCQNHWRGLFSIPYTVRIQPKYSVTREPSLGSIAKMALPMSSLLFFSAPAMDPSLVAILLVLDLVSQNFLGS